MQFLLVKPTDDDKLKLPYLFLDNSFYLIIITKVFIYNSDLTCMPQFNEATPTRRFERSENTLRTLADELLELVKKSGKISVEDASKSLKVSFQVMQSLVDFLVEEKIFGIEYKFTTPYIYLYKEDVKSTAEGRIPVKEIMSKEHFYKKAKDKNIAYERIEGLWRSYLHKNLSHLREEFFRKAKLKHAPEEKIQELWSKYLSYL